MTRSEAYETNHQDVDIDAMGLRVPEGLWPAAGRRAIEPSPPPPAWTAQVDSFFAPRQSGTWTRSVTDPAPWRPQLRTPPPPPPPRVGSVPPKARGTGVTPAEIARVVLYLEEENTARWPLQRRRRRAIGRWVRASGLLLLAAASAWASSDASRSGDSTPAPDDRTSSSGAIAIGAQANADPAPQAPGLTPAPQLESAQPAASPPALIVKSTLSAALARGSFRARARARRAVEELALPSAAPQADGRGDSAAELDMEPSSEASTPSLEAETSAAAEQPAPRAAPQQAPRVTRAALMASPRPRYPVAALKRRIEGSAVVRFKIDVEGKVSDASIEQSNPPGVFDRAALHAIEHTRYQPRTEDGVAVETPSARKRFTFQLRQRSR